MNAQTSLFLSQSYRDAWDDYLRSLTHESFPGWDYVILTASNEQQAAVFNAQLKERRAAGCLPSHTHFAVVPDPDGKRVGSGGATLGVLRYISEHTGLLEISGLRILVIHSGGDSKRVPQYSALGKLFSPVPHELPNGRAATLFDEFMIMMSPVPSRIREGMLLLSGDVLLLFNPLQIDYSGRGAAVVSFRENVETGKEHGVFLRGEDGNVARFLHKQSVSMLRACGAVNSRNNVDIDTGAVIFSGEVLKSLYNLVVTNDAFDEVKFESYVNDRVRLSVYGDFLYAMATQSTLESFYQEKTEGKYCDELKAARTEVWNALRPYRMKLLRLAPAKFIHFGTTQEILHLMTSEVGAYRYLGWSSQVNSCMASGAAGYNSVLSDDSSIGDNCYLEVSYVHQKSRVGDNVLLSYVDVRGKTIPSNVVLHGLKQKDGNFVVRIYGIEDNPKGLLENGCSFLGNTLQMFLDKNDISPWELWKGEDHSLWTAALYPSCATISEAVEEALNVYRMVHGVGDVNRWRDARRQSLCSGFQEADPGAIITWNQQMLDLVQMSRLAGLIQDKKPASEAGALLPTHRLTRIQEQWLQEQLCQVDGSGLGGFSKTLRLNYYVGKALGGVEEDRYVAACFNTIRNAILQGGLNQLTYNQHCRIVMDRCKVSLPLRVNWGGGWSDTPPYCNENGGTVLNAAILVNGRMPVQVVLERIPEHKIVLDSRDLDLHGVFDSVESLQKTGDPYDPFALQKACLLVCGIIPRHGGKLEDILTRLGGGFVMHSEVNGVPKGSGLGTSSILAAACVKAVLTFTGIAYTDAELYSHVLCMEQIMSTGGGWQDQVGGVTKGIKYTTSLPGLEQTLRVQHIRIPDAARTELNERFTLIYTGQRRLARNLLRNVVGRYVGNEPGFLYALNEIQRVAALMRFELERGKIDAFAELLSRHWELSKMVDAGSTNTLIDQIFSAVHPLVDGKMICGAGGGGFLQVILKKGVTQQALHERLKQVFEDSNVDVWDCTLI